MALAGSLPMVVIAFRCSFRRLTKLPQLSEQVCTFQSRSLTAKPTGAQQMCNVLSWPDSNPIHQTTRLLHARPLAPPKASHYLHLLNCSMRAL